MRYPLMVPGMGSHQVEVATADLTQGARVLVDGRPAPNGAAKTEFLVPRPDGSQAIVRLTGMGLDLVPGVTVDGVPQMLTEPLQWYEWLVIALPLLLVFGGGLVGGLFGGMAAVINVALFRSASPVWARYVGALALFACAVTLDVLVVHVLLAHLHPPGSSPPFGAPQPFGAPPGFPAPPRP